MPPGRAQRNTSEGLGAPPGTLLEPAHASPTTVTLRRFEAEHLTEAVLESVSELSEWRQQRGCLWIEVTGLADTERVRQLGELFSLHPLSLEDALDPSQRAKVEQYDDYTFIVLRVFSGTGRPESHPFSLFLGDRFVITLQAMDNPAFEPVRRRLRQTHGKLRSRSADYLAYALVDTVIDHYFPVVERFDDQLEAIEDAIMEERPIDPVELVRGARRDLRTIRHALWPARDVVTGLIRDDAPHVSDETRVFLRDCYDHVMQLQEMIEFSREVTAGLLETHISKVSLKTNEIMKVLTLVATIFIPVTFITGLYGMNFDPKSSPWNMPELDWYWGYPFVLAVVVAISAGSLLYFRKRGWLGSARPK